MRTTVTIQDELLRSAKQAALERNCSLGELIEQALRESLWRKVPRGGKGRTRLPTFEGRGLQAGVDLDSGAGLLDVMEGR